MVKRNKWVCSHCNKQQIELIDAAEVEGYVYYTSYYDNDGARYCEDCLELEEILGQMEW